MVVGAIFASPLVLSCRPLPLMVGLGVYLLVMTAVWGVEVGMNARKPCLHKFLLAIVTLVAALAIWPLFTPSAVFNGISHTFVGIQKGVRWMPTTVDRWNSAVSVLQTVGALGALVVVVNLAAEATWRRRMCAAAALAGGVVVVMGILEKMGPLAGFAEWLRHRYWAQGVPFGTFDYHGNAGTFLNLVIPAVAAMAIQTQHRLRRLGWLVLLAACYVGVVLNVSRAALAISVMLAPVVVGTVYWAGARHRWSDVGVCVAVVLLIGGLVATGRSPAVRRLQDVARTLANPYYDRALTYRTAWDLAKERPVFGAGAGSYRLLVQTSGIRGNYFAPAYVPGKSFSVLSDVEEDYLQTLVEWGWVGLSLWALLPVGGLVCLAIAWRRRGDGPWWPYVLIGAGIVGVFVHAMIDCPLQNSAIQLYVCGYLGLAWSSVGWKREEAGVGGDAARFAEAAQSSSTT
jgi:hypothetical protein